MYITAHKITNPQKQEHGINSFLYIHPDIEIIKPISKLSEKELNHYTQENTGELKIYDYEIDPGGNTVLSYLDVVINDSCTLADLVQAMDKFVLNCKKFNFPLIGIIDNVAIGFSMIIALHGREISEYYELSSAIQRIFRKYKMQQSN
jgi:hypothetical protein